MAMLDTDKWGNEYKITHLKLVCITCAGPAFPHKQMLIRQQLMYHVELRLFVYYTDIFISISKLTN